jgi:two-component system CheB/CheR fusion protein
VFDQLRDKLIPALLEGKTDRDHVRIWSVVCRNLLIYLQRDVQADVIALFHDALGNEGLLVLGTSETIEPSELFTCEDKARSVYRRGNVPHRAARLPVFPFEPRKDRPAPDDADVMIDAIVHAADG